jgi:hypothetical protein
VKEAAYTWVVAVAIDNFAFEVLFVVLKLFLNVRKLRVKLILLRISCLCQAAVLTCYRHRHTFRATAGGAPCLSITTITAIVLLINNDRSIPMTRVDEINAQIAKLEAEREEAMKAERANVLAKMKADIKLYGFKTTDFKGVLATRAKRGSKTGTAAKKTPAKKSPK